MKFGENEQKVKVPPSNYTNIWAVRYSVYLNIIKHFLKYRKKMTLLILYPIYEC